MIDGERLDLKRRRHGLVFFLPWVISPLFVTSAPGQSHPAGVVVEEVEEGSGVEKAGILHGDVLLSWRRLGSAARGGLHSPFDAGLVELEQAPRGQIEVVGRRQGQSFVTVLPPGKWDWRLRPPLSEGALFDFLEGRRLVAENQPTKGLELWWERGDRLRTAQEHEGAAWFFLRIATLHFEESSWKPAQTALEAALQEARAAAKPSILAQLHDFLGRVLWIRNLFEEAAVSYRRAHELWQALAPRGLAAAASLKGLGNVAWARGDLDTADAFYRRSLAILEEQAPVSLELATVLNNLAAVAMTRGDPWRAEQLHQRALSIREQLAPGGPDVAQSLNNLGLLARRRGDLSTAEALFRKAHAIYHQHASGSLVVAFVLNNLGNVASDRRELELAETYHLRSLEIREKLAPMSLSVAQSLTNLGNVAWRREQLTTAATLYERAVESYERLAPEHPSLAENLSNLGQVASRRGDLTAARALHRRALAIHQGLAPQGFGTAQSLASLGDVAERRGDLAAAENLYRQALAILEKVAAGTGWEAKASYALGLVHRQLDRPELAMNSFRRSLAALESQTARLGGFEETGSRFAARFAEYYRQSIDLLIELGRPAEAFHALERFRARRLLDLLADRDLISTAPMPTDLKQELQSLEQEYDDTLGQLIELADEVTTRTAELRRRLTDIRVLKEEVKARVRERLPRLDVIEGPTLLNLHQVQDALDPGTLLLSYSVGETASYLFAVGPQESSLEVISLEIDGESLREAVLRFRRFLEEGPSTEAIRHLGGQLTARLLAPVARRIAQAERLLILADGALHSLPFAALPDPNEDPPRYLVEAKPLHLAASATVFAGLERTRRGRSVTRIVAFGDPSYPASPGEEETAPLLQPVLRGGFHLGPLPATRLEVESIRQIFPDSTVIYLGAEATEERFKSLGEEVDILHFAGHAIVDERSPLDSALVFTVPQKREPGRGDGLLRAGEILERLRISAELVVLSGCETGHGEELAGEGILGLTWALQYAGARSLLASLWSVSDASTAELMKRFYQNLKAGQTKDQALRQAQIALIKSPIEIRAGDETRELDASHPFYWAAFQLIGEWR